MNRADFIKATLAALGASAILPAIESQQPVDVPSAEGLSGRMFDGDLEPSVWIGGIDSVEADYTKYARLTLKNNTIIYSGKLNQSKQTFPTSTGRSSDETFIGLWSGE